MSTFSDSEDRLVKAASVFVDDHIFHTSTDKYLGVVTEVRRITVRFTGPHHQDGLATRHEIYIGAAP